MELTSSTDASGTARFSLTGEVRDLYLYARRPGFVPQAIRWDYNANSPALPDKFLFHMEKATTASGRVVDQDEKPVAGATVIIKVSKRIRSLGSGLISSGSRLRPTPTAAGHFPASRRSLTQSSWRPITAAISRNTIVTAWTSSSRSLRPRWIGDTSPSAAVRRSRSRFGRPQASRLRTPRSSTAKGDDLPTRSRRRRRMPRVA